MLTGPHRLIGRRVAPPDLEFSLGTEVGIRPVSEHLNVQNLPGWWLSELVEDTHDVEHFDCDIGDGDPHYRHCFS